MFNRHRNDKKKHNRTAGARPAADPMHHLKDFVVESNWPT
jgi:hypothetical protein